MRNRDALKNEALMVIAALTIAACARGLDSYGYVPPATLTQGLDQCLTSTRGNKAMRSSKFRNDAPVIVPRALTRHRRNGRVRAV